MKEITIAICTYNRCSLLKSSLDSLVEQIEKKEKFKVIVVDNNSNDKTKDVVLSFLKKLQICYIFEKKQGLSYARNRAVKECKTAYIGFLDDDAIADKRYIKRAYEIIKKIKPLIFGGSIYPFYKSEIPKWFKDKYEIRKIDNICRYVNCNEYLSGSNIFFKKRIFLNIGYFNTSIGMAGEKVSFGEETHLQEKAHRNNIAIYYDPDLVVNHYTPELKMKLKNIIKRNILSCCDAYKFLNNDNILINIKIVIRNIAIIFFLILVFFFRDKKKYPYWQNYFIERFLHRIRGFIWIYLDLKGIFLKNKKI